MYVPPHVKAFKTIPPLELKISPPPRPTPSERTESSASSSDSEGQFVSRAPRASRSIRFRLGRGGRAIIDRRIPMSTPDSLTRLRKRPVPSDDEMDDTEQLMRLRERWKFDSDEGVGADEQDRVLVDEYDPK